MKQYNYAAIALAVFVVLGLAGACQGDGVDPAAEPTPDMNALIQAAVEQAMANAASPSTPNIQATVAAKVEATVTAQAVASAEVTGVATSVEYVDARGTYWAEFTKPPTICNGFVTLAGQLKNGATFASSNWYTFTLGDTDWKDRIAFLAPLEPGIDYPELYEGEQAAATHTAASANREFELVSAIPPRFETFDGVEIAIWGYVPAGYEGHNPSGGATTLLREATVPRC